MHLGFGAVAGAGAGFLMARALRIRDLIPEGLENIVVLSFTIALFHLSNAVFDESGIAAVIIAGVVVGNSPSHVERELQEFKEQLTLMFIGMLFVLLAADVRIDHVVSLGWPGVIAVGFVIAVVRPLAVFTSTTRGTLSLRERVFLAGVGPRGIVAAAIASLFAAKLSHAGISGGLSLRALVFAVIAATVLWSGLSGSLLARALGLKRREDRGWVILGANALAQTLAKLIQEKSEEVICIESNARACQTAEAAGLQVIHGNGLRLRSLRRAEIDARSGAVGLTTNDEANLLFVQRAQGEASGQRYCVAIGDWEEGVTANITHQQGAEVLFGAATDVDRWSQRLVKKTASIEWWRLDREEDSGPLCTDELQNPPYLAMAIRRNQRVVPVSDKTRFEQADEVAFLLDLSRADGVRRTLKQQGWTP
jgi:NhaP-type Na+/H+ and K+/H+ antiporter